MKFLNNISTHWTEIENLKQKGELRELTDYLAGRYFEPIAKALKKNRPVLDEYQTHELASDIFYDFIKNDYQLLKNIKRKIEEKGELFSNKTEKNGNLRGYFSTIIRRKLSRLPKETFSLNDDFDVEDKNWECYAEIMIELDIALKKLKEEKFELYEVFMLYTFRGKRMLEISQLLEVTESAVKMRIFNARKFLSVYMKDYKV